MLSERRMIIILLVIAFALNLLINILELVGIKMPSYNILAIVTTQDGTFTGNDGQSQDWSDIQIFFNSTVIVRCCSAIILNSLLLHSIKG